MEEENLWPSHLDITFSVGTNLLVISPTAFDVDPARRDSGIVHSQINFEAPWCKGGVAAAFMPEALQKLLVALNSLMKKRPASLSFADLDGWFHLEGSWNAEHQVAVFKVTTPARLKPGPKYEKIVPHVGSRRGVVSVSSH